MEAGGKIPSSWWSKQVSPKGRRQIKEAEDSAGPQSEHCSIWRRPVGGGPGWGGGTGWSVALTQAVVELASIEGVELMLNMDVE